MSIPRKIHYCWFGNGKKPDCFVKCLESWKRYAPDFEIVEWNESNTNLAENAFMQQAYEAKKYAFVSDIARLKIIHEHGGIYLDTDVELKAPLNDLLENQAFFFFDVGNCIATGLGFGAVANNYLIQRMLDDYKSLSFSGDSSKKLTCPKINTQSIKNTFPDFQDENRTQMIDGHAFLSSYDYKHYGLHYYEFSWMSEEDRNALKYQKKRRRFFKLRRIIRNPKIFDFFYKHNLQRVAHIYRFFVYDFIDNGTIYYAYKFIQRIKKRFHFDKI